MGVRRVRDAAFWGVPVGTVIAPGMKPKREGGAGKAVKAATAGGRWAGGDWRKPSPAVSKFDAAASQRARAITGSATPARSAQAPGSWPGHGAAAAMFAAGAGKGRLHAATSRPMKAPSTTRGTIGRSAKSAALGRDLPKRPDGSPVTGGDYVKVKGSGQVLKVSRRDELMGQPGYRLMTHDDQDHKNTTFYPAGSVEYARTPHGSSNVADRSRGHSPGAPKAAGADVSPRAAEARRDIYDYLKTVKPIPGSTENWANVADVRDALGSKYSREEVDTALRSMVADPHVTIIPIANQKGLKGRDRKGAVQIGGEDHHAIRADGTKTGNGPVPEWSPYASKAADAADRARSEAQRKALEPEVPDGYSRDTLDSMSLASLQISLTMQRESSSPSPAKIAQLEREIAKRGGAAKAAAKAAPKPKTARATFDAARISQVSGKLRSATSRDAAQQALSGLTVAQLRELGKSNGVTLGAKYTKGRIVEALVEALAGRRLDSLALSRR